MPNPPTIDQRLLVALRAVEGLSVGDAVGDRFLTSGHHVEDLIEMRVLLSEPWPVTDNTALAIAVADDPQ